MKKFLEWLRREVVLVLAAAAAIGSMWLVPPSWDYLQYIDFPVLVMLFCLMAVVAGWQHCGAFDRLSALLLRHVGDTRRLGLVLVALCFFTSMLITNDVALLTFAPLTLTLLGNDGDGDANSGDSGNGKLGRGWLLIRLLTLMTVAANLGSMLTPLGNPQNIYLFTCYDMRLGQFFALVLPLGAVSLILLLGLCFTLPRLPLHHGSAQALPALHRGLTWQYCGLFAVCVLTLIDIIPPLATLYVLLVCLCAFDFHILARVDYGLLLTFVCFFIFSGNLAALPQLQQSLAALLQGRELLLSALVSQVISNVPAAVLLSGFTDQVGPLLLGVNVGGLGTLVASLASLISYKIYVKSSSARPGRYLLHFSIVNLALLALLLPLALLLS